MDAARFLNLETPVPVRHKRKVPFLPRSSVSAEVGRRLLEIHELDKELGNSIVPPSEFKARIEETVATNLFESVRLEGNRLPLAQVRLTSRRSMEGPPVVPKEPERREIVNHMAVWLLPEELELPWSTQTVLGLHRELLTRVDPRASPGAFRSTDVAVVNDQDEEVFLTAPPKHVVAEIESLLGWVNEVGPSLHPVVAATLAFHEFESIHPFVEGNGRTGRVLFHAYLQNRGLPFAYRSRLEVELLSNPEAYYGVLRWTDQTGDYSALLDFFTEATVEAYREAVGWFKARSVAGSLGPVSYRILDRARSGRDWFGLREVRGWVASLGDQSLRAHLNELVSTGLLVSKGATRSKAYRFADPFSTIRDQMIPLRRALGLGPRDDRLARSSRRAPTAGRRP
jgi:fido (protein-threonine AMPylation protein)